MSKIDRKALQKSWCHQPCTTCGNFLSCSWAVDFKPIDGWKVIRSVKGTTRNEQITYTIIECPQYFRSEYHPVVRENAFGLMAALYTQAVRDWRKLNQQRKKLNWAMPAYHRISREMEDIEKELPDKVLARLIKEK